MVDGSVLFCYVMLLYVCREQGKEVVEEEDGEGKAYYTAERSVVSTFLLH